jgi:hypothetical protein
MMHTIAGLFESHRTADLVVEHLVQEYGIPRERVRVYGRDASSGAAEAPWSLSCGDRASASPKKRFGPMPRALGLAPFS